MDKRKELKSAYKQSTPPMGVYQIKNNMNGKLFIGCSLNLSGRANSYQFFLDFQSNHNKILQEDIKLYGLDAFSFEILETLDSEKIPKNEWSEAVSLLEQKWLNILQPYNEKGYNKQKLEKDK